MKTLYKNVLATMLITLVTLSFSACSDDAHFADAENQISINVACTTPTTINSYIPLYSEDVVVKAEDNTTIEIYHTTDGSKRVCLVSGNAYIIRK